MKIALRLVTATAIGLAVGGVAQAGDSNTLYLKQIGGNNSASVHQANGGGNGIGRAGDPVTQDGNRNDFRFSNAGYGGGSNNDIRHAKQAGDDNYFSNSVWNGADNNRIYDFEQQGDRNRARIDMNGSDNGLVQTVRQTGNANHLVIEQEGSSSNGNVIWGAIMTGDNNGLGPDGNGDKRQAGTYLYQSGNKNVIWASAILGNGNVGPAGGSEAYRNTHRIEQRGNNNGNNNSTAATWGSGNGIDYNRIWIFQTGDRNNFYVMQGLTSASTGNHVTISQTGDDNFVQGDQSGDHDTFELTQIGNGNGGNAFQYGTHNVVGTVQIGDGNWGSGYQYGDRNLLEATQVGNSNNLGARQDGDNNVIKASFTGDFNGRGNMSGVAGNLVSGSSGMGNGSIWQTGASNSAKLTVTSNSNLFAFRQLGDNNVINGTIGGCDGNQVAVLQQGNHHIANFTQWGSGNNIAISQ